MHKIIPGSLANICLTEVTTGKWTQYDCFITIWSMLWDKAECGDIIR